MEIDSAECWFFTAEAVSGNSRGRSKENGVLPGTLLEERRLIGVHCLDRAVEVSVLSGRSRNSRGHGLCFPLVTDLVGRSRGLVWCEMVCGRQPVRSRNSRGLRQRKCGGDDDRAPTTLWGSSSVERAGSGRSLSFFCSRVFRRLASVDGGRSLAGILDVFSLAFSGSINRGAA